MMRYAVRDLHTLLLWIDHMSNSTSSQENYRFGNDALLSQSEKKTVLSQIDCIRKHLTSLEVHDAVSVCDEFKTKLNHDKINLGECRGYLLSLRRMLTDAMEKRVFMYVPLKVSKFAQSYQGPMTQYSSALFAGSSGVHESNPFSTKPFGNKVFAVFPDARFDAEQVALCMVAGASTAAIFHMMRVVEAGIRVLGKDLGLSKIKETHKPILGGKLTKPKVKVVPIENCTWERIHNQIRAKIDSRLAKLRQGPVKDRKQSFYSSILHDFHGFKDAWRNHVMHTRGQYNEDQAVGLLSHVDRFIQALASTQPTPPQPPPRVRSGRFRRHGIIKPTSSGSI